MIIICERAFEGVAASEVAAVGTVPPVPRPATPVLRRDMTGHGNPKRITAGDARRLRDLVAQTSTAAQARTALNAHARSGALDPADEAAPRAAEQAWADALAARVRIGRRYA